MYLSLVIMLFYPCNGYMQLVKGTEFLGTFPKEVSQRQFNGGLV